MSARISGERLPRWPGWAFALVALLWPCAASAQTPAGTRIESVALVTYETAGGQRLEEASNRVVLVVAQQAGVDLAPARHSVARPGDRVVLAHSLRNPGNGADAYALAATSARGWPLRLFFDADGDGLADAAEERAWSDAVAVARGDSAPILLELAVPAAAAARGVADTVRLQAASRFDAAATDVVVDRVDVQDAGIHVTLHKSVDQRLATPGALLTYTVRYAAEGTVPGRDFLLTDSIPSGTEYVPGTAQVDGRPQTEAAGAGAAEHDAVAGVVRLVLDSIAPGSAGELRFQVRVREAEPVVSTARATYRTRLGVEAASSNQVRTDVVFPELALTKTLTSPPLVGNGDSVSYVLEYENTSAELTATDVVLVDSLPAGLVYVSASIEPRVSGRALRWELGTLPPDSAARIDLITRVEHTSYAPLDLQNVATLASTSSADTAAVVASAARVVVDNAADALLGLTKAAEVLEVGLGEVVPYTLVAENTGELPLDSVRIVDALPPGTRLVPGSITGAGLPVVRGDSITFLLPDGLAPGASATVRYAAAVVSGEGGTLRSRGYAVSAGGRVRSADAIAMVRLRATHALASRAAIGKVWADADGDGVQGPDEHGVAGVDVWSDGGEIATTDEEGRFSMRDLGTGARSFRLDPATLPLTYGVDADAGADLEVRDVSGWTTPRVSFRVLPREARLTGVALPLDVTFQARPIRGDELVAALGPAPADPCRAEPVERGTPVRLDDVQFELDRATLTPGARRSLDRVAEVLAATPSLRAEVAGHTDTTGPYAYNRALSEARARSVVAYLVERGVAEERLTAAGYGPDRPVAPNTTFAGRARNRRVELVLEDGASADDADRIARAATCAPPAPRLLGEYRLVVRNPYDRALAPLVYRTDRGFDSIQVRVDGVPVPSGWNAAARVYELPPLGAASELVVLGWLSEHPDSAVVHLARSGEPGGRITLRARFHNPLMPVTAHPPFVRLDSLPAARELPAGVRAVGTLDARDVTGDTAVYRLPAGWDAQEDPALRRLQARDGGGAVAYAVAGRGVREIVLRPGAAPAAPIVVRVPALRTSEEREAERRRSVIAGPAVALFHPEDGSVHGTDRLFVGVNGEPGAAVVLLDGDSVLREATLRPDGVADFVAVKLAPGPHRLRVRMTNSWGQTRWDSLAVHVSGPPASFQLERASLTLTGDGQTLAPVRARVLDAWGVPVTYGPTVTAEAAGAEPVASDADPSSVGMQLKADGAGWIELDLRPGHEVGAGALRLAGHGAATELPLEVLPPARPLMVTAVGRAGVGAAPDDYGAVTVRGRLDERTSVVLRYDSRRTAADDRAFGGDADPLDAGRYPLLGDAGGWRREGATRGVFSATLRRGLDWVAVGDLATMGFTDELALTTYHRSITGAAARLEAGATTWQAFASATRQAVTNRRLRGQGISGPYELDGTVLPGTERVVLETRALENPDRVLAAQAMTRWLDYQVDYESGVLLFQRPVPATDEHGNPVFIAVTLETLDAGETNPVWGVRATTDASRLLGFAAADVAAGATLIREDGAAGGFQLTGGNVRVAAAGSELRAELSHAQSPDSSGLALSVEGRVEPVDGLALTAAWRSIGDGYHNPSSGRYRGGSSELRFRADYELPTALLTLSHERQAFSGFDVERARSRAGVTYSLSPALTLETALVDDAFSGATELEGAPAGEARLQWDASEEIALWIDGRRHVGGSGTAAQPDFAGVGGEYRITERLKLSARHRQVSGAGLVGGAGYGVSDVGVRSRFGAGEVWTSYQVAGVDGSRRAAVVGLDNQVALGRGWTVGGSLERRVGLAGADPADMVRALPFLQQEEDYWATTLSLAHAPGDAPYRLSGRGEYRDGETRSTRMLELAGDLSLSDGLALLSRQELLQVETAGAGEAAAGRDLSRRVSSLWGVALRPAAHDRLNVLAKLEWVDAVNPIGGGVLTSRGDERRLIATAEAIWEPVRHAEVGLRWAARRTEASRLLDDGVSVDIGSSATYVGWRAAAPVTDRFGVRVEGRVLAEEKSGTVLHDLAPQLTFAPVPTLELAAGYRFGDLRDPDFAVSGGAGAFLTAGARLTERTLDSAAAYWRERLAR